MMSLSAQLLSGQQRSEVEKYQLSYVLDWHYK